MGLMGTLAKVAIGYAAARGVDKLSGGQGLASLMGGAQGNMQEMMAKLGGGAGGAGGLQDMLGQMGLGGGAAQPGAAAAPQGGLMGALGGGGAGLAGVLAMMGGAAGASSDGARDMMAAFGNEKGAAEQETAAGHLLRAMIQAAKADGDIDADEQKRILDTVGDDADADDIAFVRAQLAAPVDVDALAADTTPGQEAQVYAMSLMPIRVDTQAEKAYLDALARALRLSQPTVNTLHAQMGVAPLYG